MRQSPESSTMSHLVAHIHRISAVPNPKPSAPAGPAPRGAARAWAQGAARGGGGAGADLSIG